MCLSPASLFSSVPSRRYPNRSGQRAGSPHRSAAKNTPLRRVADLRSAGDRHLHLGPSPPLAMSERTHVFVLWTVIDEIPQFGPVPTDRSRNADLAFRSANAPACRRRCRSSPSRGSSRSACSRSRCWTRCYPGPTRRFLGGRAWRHLGDARAVFAGQPGEVPDPRCDLRRRLLQHHRSALDAGIRGETHRRHPTKSKA